MSSRLQAAAIVAAAIVGGVGAGALAQSGGSVWDGAYTNVQADRGASSFDKECAGCHGPDGEGGGMAPALSGPAFNANYDGQTLFDLFERNRATMPVGREGQLSAQQIADITAFVLRVNKYPAGPIELPSQATVLRQIRFLTQKPER